MFPLYARVDWKWRSPPAPLARASRLPAKSGLVIERFAMRYTLDDHGTRLSPNKGLRPALSISGRIAGTG